MVKASKSDRITAAHTTRPNSRRNVPIMPPTKTIGKKTETTVAVMARTERATSFVPFSELSTTAAPLSMCRKIFSRTTMASSITRPTASDMARRVIVLIPRPRTAMTAKVPTMMIGRPATVISVLRRLRKKDKHDQSGEQTAEEQILDGFGAGITNRRRLIHRDRNAKVRIVLAGSCSVRP